MLPYDQGPPPYSHVIQQAAASQLPADVQAEYAAQRTAEQRAELERHLGALASSGRFAQQYGYPRP